MWFNFFSLVNDMVCNGRSLSFGFHFISKNSSQVCFGIERVNGLIVGRYLAKCKVQALLIDVQIGKVLLYTSDQGFVWKPFVTITRSFHKFFEDCVIFTRSFRHGFAIRHGSVLICCSQGDKEYKMANGNLSDYVWVCETSAHNLIVKVTSNSRCRSETVRKLRMRRKLWWPLDV